jgi:hypothetical protein
MGSNSMNKVSKKKTRKMKLMETMVTPMKLGESDYKKKNTWKKKLESRGSLNVMIPSHYARIITILVSF